jgi:hypothetical protein
VLHRHQLVKPVNLEVDPDWLDRSNTLVRSVAEASTEKEVPSLMTLPDISRVLVLEDDEEVMLDYEPSLGRTWILKLFIHLP